MPHLGQALRELLEDRDGSLEELLAELVDHLRDRRSSEAEEDGNDAGGEEPGGPGVADT
jgi:hypothetical protein